MKPVSYTCQKCRKRHPSTHQRSIYTKAYTGPCGDSFCYASCDSEVCRPIVVAVCDKCAVLLSRVDSQDHGGPAPQGEG